MTRHDNPNPLADAVRAAIDRRAARTGEPNSEQRDAMAERERETERQQREAAGELVAAAREVLAGLHRRIDTAPQNAVPVFDGIARLADAINAARAAGLGK